MVVKVKYFAVDIDGTLTDANSRLELAAIDEVRRLEGSGYKVILASAQSFCALATLSRCIGTCGIIIGENGGVLGRNSQIAEILGDKEKPLAGLRVLKKNLGDAVKEKTSLSRYVDIVLERSFDLKLGNTLLQREGVDATISDSGFAYHLTSAGIDKGAGLRRAAALNGFDCEGVVAIGDGLNDIEMFQAAAYSVTLANAPSEVKRAASLVTSAGYGAGFCEAVRAVAEKFSLKIS